MQNILRQQIEKIVKLTDEELDFALSHFTERTYKKHQYVVQAGAPVPNDHFIAKGFTEIIFL